MRSKIHFIATIGCLIMIAICYFDNDIKGEIFWIVPTIMNFIAYRDSTVNE